MLVDIFLSVNNWKILTLKVSYEFLVVIMVWRSDLFSILICSALSSLKVNAVHHLSHKTLLEDLRADLCMGISHSPGFKGSEWVFLLMLASTISTGRKKKRGYVTCILFERQTPGDAESSFLNGPVFLHLPECSCEVLGNNLGARVLFLLPTQWAYVRKLVVWKHLEKIFVSTQAVLCHSNIKPSLSLHFVFVNVIIL